jgi:hypothetical protein
MTKVLVRCAQNPDSNPPICVLCCYSLFSFLLLRCCDRNNGSNGLILFHCVPCTPYILVTYFDFRFWLQCTYHCHKSRPDGFFAIFPFCYRKSPHPFFRIPREYAPGYHLCLPDLYLASPIAQNLLSVSGQLVVQVATYLDSLLHQRWPTVVSLCVNYGSTNCSV